MSRSERKLLIKYYLVAIFIINPEKKPFFQFITIFNLMRQKWAKQFVTVLYEPNRAR
jgi:hypothetical protein